MKTAHRVAAHRVAVHRVARRPLIACALLLSSVSLSGASSPGDGPASVVVSTAASAVFTSSSDADTSVAPLIAPAGHGTPDRTADHVGGAAVRLRTHDGDELPGDVFLLMASKGSPAQARVYDETPFLLDGAEIHPEPAESNELAAEVVTELTGTAVAHVDFTSAPGGGYSAGLTYAIGYLEIMSEGAFTDQLPIAVSGRIRDHGYVGPITAIDEKTAAAELAGAAVLFTASVPSAEVIAQFGARYEGELFRARNTGASLAEERRWDRYEAWGASRTPGEMDIIGVRHVGDVAAYLCGAGSIEACDVRDLLANLVFDSSGVAGDRAQTVAADTNPISVR